MNTYQGQRLFRPSWWLLLAVVLAESLFLSGACLSYLIGGWTLTSALLAVFAVLGAAGVLEALIRRIVLAEDALYVVDLLYRRRYAKADIVRVDTAKGSPTSLLLANGRWAHLPDLGHNMANSIRAWLQHGP